MNAIALFAFVIAGVCAIDFFGQTTRHKNDAAHGKSAGLLPLLILALGQKQRRLIEKKMVIRQLLLSSSMVFFLWIALYFLLILDVPVKTNIFYYGLLLAPLFLLPFLYLLYDLVAAHPLSLECSLKNFRLRGVLALIMSANIIFVSLLPRAHVVVNTLHFLLAFSAVVGAFYLCSRQRKKISCYDAPYRDKDSSFEPMLFNYLASLLELFYYFTVIFLIFLQEPLATYANNFAAIWPFVMPFFLLIASFIVVKICLSFDTPLSLQFYEEKILPLSFLFLGMVSIFRYYF